jgi:hypothetical protein
MHAALGLYKSGQASRSHLLKMSSPSRSDLYAPILTRPNVTPVSKTLNTVLISVAATPHATYAFHWALKHFLKPSDIATQKVIFILYKIVLFTVQTVTRTASSYVGNYIGGNSGVGNSNTLDKAEQKLYNAACLLLRGYRKEILSKFPDANIEMVVSHGI